MRALLAIGLLVVGPALRADEPKKVTVDDLQGTWLFESASRASTKDSLASVWHAKLTIRDKTISVEKFLDLKTPLKGKIELDPAERVGHIDLKLEEFDLNGLSSHSNISARTLAGVYRREGGRIRFCFHSEAGGARPKSAEDAGPMLLSFSVLKAPKGFVNFPNEVAVKVTTLDGKPAKSIGVGSSLVKARNEKTKEYDGKWGLDEPKTTDNQGKSKFEYADPSFWAQSVIAWDEANKLIGFGSMSPASVAANPEVVIVLKPVCNVKLNITCAELKKAGRTEHFHCTVITRAGHWIASNGNTSGQLDFPLPAGDYTLMISGSTFLGTRREPLIVPENCADYTAPEIKMDPIGLLMLLGKPAPELVGVLGWKGEAVKLADLKGKVVLLEFWGYWCGSCIASMPDLFELHEKFADKGLAIVGIHLDSEGEVDTAAKLDAKIAGFKKEVWKGKDLPFPVALTSGKREGGSDEPGGSVALYGVRSYPGTILIDRQGKVVGHFNARDTKDAIAQMEKLLADEKK